MLEQTSVEAGLQVPKAFAVNWKEIASTQLEAVSITATPEDVLSFGNSTFGYYPMLPATADYPKDYLGKYMFPLAQINCSELPPVPGYPQSGYLQFYISAFDEQYGMDFNKQDSQTNFRVLFYEESEVKEHKTDFLFLDETMASEELPVYEPHRLSFALQNDYVGIGDTRGENNRGFQIQDIIDRYPNVKKELEDISYRLFQGNGHKMGGYAFFTQTDPREYNQQFKEYILLLQIDTDDEIMWGDSGVANFFIHPADLAKKDFSKVMYNWDCC